MRRLTILLWHQTGPYLTSSVHVTEYMPRRTRLINSAYISHVLCTHLLLWHFGITYELPERVVPPLGSLNDNVNLIQR